ncbi:MAG: sulfide/dihydroorotate dehydrogenase-like FAD/NAD-binding protein [Candidatus Nezhaarchaeales archaeon]
MYEVLALRQLAPNIKEMDVYAPKIARYAKPGQFVIVMACGEGERIPLTLVDWDGNEGWIRMVFSEVGASTHILGQKNVGDKLYCVLGPLGNPTRVGRFGAIAVVAGGVAVSAAYPVARAFKAEGNKVLAFLGARSSNLLIYVDKLATVSDEIHISTDDGSLGFSGFVTQLLEATIMKGLRPDLIWTVGPAHMMKACSDVAKKWNLKAIASLNPIMVCGIGMCGACRVKVDGTIRFTCVEGPEFDATKVDWDELIQRLSMYREEEKLALSSILTKEQRLYMAERDLKWLR